MKRMQTAMVMFIGLWAGSIQAQTAWNSAVISNADKNTTGSGSFTWSTTGAWDTNGVANGAGLSVSLEPRLTVDSIVTVDNTYTAGTMTARCANKAIRFSGNGKLVINNGIISSTLNVHSYVTRFSPLRADFYVDIQLDSDLILRMGAGRQESADVGRLGKTISGTGKLTLELSHYPETYDATRLFKLGENATNTYSGGTLVRHVSASSYGSSSGDNAMVALAAKSTGAFGTGDVTFDCTQCTFNRLAGTGSGRGMWIRCDATNVFASTATLNIIATGDMAFDLNGKNQIVAALKTNNVSVADGVYSAGNFDWLYGTGTLTVGSGGTPEPEIALLGSNGSTEISSGSTTINTTLGTDFGEVLADGGAPVSHTFTITNTGLATLTLPSTPVTVLGGHSADFTVTQPASLSIAQNGSTTFSISFDPSVVGVRTGLVSIANNDSNENPYTFKIQGTGTEPLPSISILSSNGTLVVTNGTTVISEALGTDFGEIRWNEPASVERIFVITNKGTASLTLTLPITVSGVDSADFTVTQPDSSSIPVGQSGTFKIACDPSALGVRTGLVSIVNNDSLRTPYTFKIQGIGMEPVPIMSVLNSNQTLVVSNGTTVISEALGTDFWEIIWSGSVSAERTFVITNKGTASLTLTLPITVSGVNSSDFTVTQPALSSVPVGQSVTFKIACDPSALGVRTGLVSIVNNDTSPYRFNIQGIGIPPNQLSFQQGDGGACSETAFTWLEERYPNANYGNSTFVQLEEEYRGPPTATTHLLFQGLIAFTNIIGKAVGQIAPESTVSSAILTFTVSNASSPTIPVTFHQMLKPWSENEATWTHLTSTTLFGNSATNPLDNAAALLANPSDPIGDGGGEPGVDYVATNVVSKALYPAGKVDVDVTAIVQAWANGTPNYGLYMQYLSDDGVVMSSDDAATLRDRPRLVVISTPPPPKGTMVSFH